MNNNPDRNAVVIVDNVDIDNSLAVLAACHPSLHLNVKAVIVTGRFANPNREARITDVNVAYSNEVRRRNARRLQGLLRRAGRHVPVFEGLTPPATIVPHRLHIDEKLLDLHNDMNKSGHDGDLKDAIKYLVGLKGTIDFIVGGPLGEAAVIMREPRLQGRLGTVTCQLGLFGFGNVKTMAGGGLTFNSAADPSAARAILKEWPGEVYLVPTNVTKLPSVGFDAPEQLRGFGMVDELVRLYEIFWREALEPRGERIYPHDVHPVFLMAQLYRKLPRDPYRMDEVRVDAVGSKGEISVTFNQSSPSNRRFVVRNVDSTIFMRLLRTTVG